MMFSIIIASYNEGQHIQGTVNTIKKNTPAGTYEIIVVDDGSTDNSTSSLSDVRVLKSGANRGVIAARNSGAAAARGENLVFFDAHTYPEPGWLPPLSKRLTDGLFLTGCVSSFYCGNCMKGYGAHLMKGLNWEWDYERAEKETGIVPGGFTVVTKKTFFEAGMFDPGFRKWGVEDAELSVRAWLTGYRIVVVPESEIAHVHSQKDLHPSADRPFPSTSEQYFYNTMRLAHLHLDQKHIDSVLNNAGADVKRAAREVLADPSFQARKRWIDSRRKHDFNWYAQKFGLKW